MSSVNKFGQNVIAVLEIMSFVVICGMRIVMEFNLLIFHAFTRDRDSF
jgi:hypothetical protein